MSSKDGVIEELRSVRDAQPNHYLFKIESFTTILEENIEKIESDDFEVADYKWRLCLYPSGNKKENGNGHISLYLVLKDTYARPKARRFHAMKTEWGFSQLLSMDEFNDTSKGYLFQDSCVFGAEIFVARNSGKGECISWIKEPENKCFKFSTINAAYIFSDEFIIGEQTWKLCLYPRGDVHIRGEWLSVFLFMANSLANPLKHRLYARYKLRIKDQISNKHCEKEVNHWFSPGNEDWGLDEFKKLSDLKDSSNGFIVNDTLTIEVEFMVISIVKKLPNLRNSIAWYL